MSKFRDGYRVSIASQFGTRDAIIARSADDVLMVAEAYIRKGEASYDKAIEWINKLRDRAGYADKEDRSKNVDGGQAYKTILTVQEKVAVTLTKVLFIGTKHIL